jgi:hypothetical protein
MTSIAHGGMNPRMTEKPKPPKKILENIRMSEAENGGHMAEHHFTSFEHPPEQHVFGMPADGDAKPMLPKGHILQHVAEHMHIPHTVMGEQEESAHKTNAMGHEPDEEDELEES